MLSSAVLFSVVNLVLADGKDYKDARMSDDSVLSVINKEVKPSRLFEDESLEINGVVLEDVLLDTGTRIMFIEMEDGVGAFEQIPIGAPGIAEFPALRGAPLIDIFLAISEPGTPVPESIKHYSKPSQDIGEQGWIHNAVRLGHFDLPRANCTNSTFSNAVTSKGYDDRGTPVLRLDKLVGVTGYFKEHKQCFGTNWVGGCPKFYNYEVNGVNGSIFHNVDKYYTRVALCGLGSHPTITSNYGSSWTHPGPLLQVSYRNSNNNGYYYVISKDFSTNEIGWAYAWHYTDGSGYWNYDWRTQITLSKKNDYFDIGHAVEDLGY